MHNYINVTLHNGVSIPSFGFNADHVPPESLYDTILDAIHYGYRHISFVIGEGYEKTISKALKDCGVERNDLFLSATFTPQQINTNQTYHSLEVALKRLELNQIDCLFLKRPLHSKENYAPCWKAMETLYKEGKVRVIGINKFQSEQVEDLLNNTDIAPMIGRCRLYPGSESEDFIRCAEDHRIMLEGCLPINHAPLTEVPAIRALAVKHGVDPEEILYQYLYSRRCIALWPKTTIPSSTFDLSEEEMLILSHLQLQLD